MNVSDCSRRELSDRLKGPGLHTLAGPFLFHLQTDIPVVVDGIRVLYGDFAIAEDGDFVDFRVAVNRRPRFPRFLRAHVAVRVDGVAVAAPLPLEQAFALFEGTLNWCVYTYAHQYFIVHAAAVERDGLAALLPAPPGSGKSTLCAALVHRGWRLLTDELTLMTPETGLIVPLPRPISLKNESLDVVRAFAPQAVIGPPSPNTIKGTIAHVRPPKESVDRMRTTSRPAWVVFPKFRADASMTGQPISKSHALMRVAECSVNYSTLGARGFHALGRMIDAVDCYEFEYSDLEEAVDWFGSLRLPQAFGESR